MALVGLVRRVPAARRHALLSLLAQLAASGVHTYASLSLRGSGAPANMRALVTAVALLAFVGARSIGSFDSVEDDTEEDAGGIAETLVDIAGCALSAGVLCLGMERLMAFTHTLGGRNRAAEWGVGLAVAGLIGAGVGVVALSIVAALRLHSRARTTDNA